MLSGEVLVVGEDADSEISATLRTLLKNVFTTNSGLHAIALIDNVNPKAVFVHAQTHDIDAIEFITTLHSIAVTIPVVLLLNPERTSSEFVVEAFKLGLTDIIPIPLADKKLVTASLEKCWVRSEALSGDRPYQQQLESLIAELEGNINILEKDQRAGSEIQKKLLPDMPWVYEGFHLSYDITPSLFISGDYVNYFPLPRNKLGFFIADVSGHGTSSAFITMLLSYMTSQFIRNLRLQEDTCPNSSICSPAELLEQFNVALLDTSIHKHVTVFAGVIDTAAATLSYSGAGHYPNPLLISEDQSSISLLSNGMPVGLDTSASYKDETIDLPAKFRLVLASDGALELLDGETSEIKQEHLKKLFIDCKTVDSMRLNLGISPYTDLQDDVSLLVISSQGE